MHTRSHESLALRAASKSHAQLVGLKKPQGARVDRGSNKPPNAACWSA